MNTVKVAVVTGANKGIGFEVLKSLCKKFDGDVYLTARDQGRGTAAVDLLLKEGLSPKFHQLDINDNDSIRKLRDFISEKYGGLDVLVNNAGIAYGIRSKLSTVERAESTLQTNFTATRNVCVQLFPLLRPHGRVVNVSSMLGHLSKVSSPSLRSQFSDSSLTEEELVKLVDAYLNDVRNGVHKENGWPTTEYQMSKVALTALTFIQQRMFDSEPEKDFVVNAVHPGYVDTDLTDHKGVLSPEEGALAPTYCALLPPNVKSPRGKYVWNDCTVASWVD